MTVEGASQTARAGRRWAHSAPLLLRIPDLTVNGEADEPRADGRSHASARLDSPPRSGHTAERAARPSDADGVPWRVRLATWWVGGGGTIVLWTLVALATLVLAAWLQVRSHPSMPVPDQTAPTSAESSAPIRQTADWEPPPLPAGETKSKTNRPVITGLRPYDDESAEPRSARAETDHHDSLHQNGAASSSNGLGERMKRAMARPFGSHSEETAPTTVRR